MVPLLVVLIVCLITVLVGTCELALGLVIFTYFERVPKGIQYVGPFWCGIFPILAAFMTFVGLRRKY